MVKIKENIDCQENVVSNSWRDNFSITRLVNTKYTECESNVMSEQLSLCFHRSGCLRNEIIVIFLQLLIC